MPIERSSGLYCTVRPDDGREYSSHFRRRRLQCKNAAQLANCRPEPPVHLPVGLPALCRLCLLCGPQLAVGAASGGSGLVQPSSARSRPDLASDSKNSVVLLNELADGLSHTYAARCALPLHRRGQEPKHPARKEVVRRILRGRVRGCSHVLQRSFGVFPAWTGAIQHHGQSGHRCYALGQLQDIAVLWPVVNVGASCLGRDRLEI
mmetsp:Transcript_101805/g.242744  ORF Transcript_101805/g.242744 Transcript_101805/m.242744 type:complete len:206 (-) Transcript_101805:765-1382(-)